MKPLSVIIVGALLIVSVVPQTASGWSIEPSTETGHYWAYDDASDPPFFEPLMPPMPGFHDIHETGSKLAPYGGEPYKYTMPDSFWYFGVWYEPGDALFLSEDGWVSFDNSSEDGFPDPPTADPPFPVTGDPNALIAPLWQDMDPTRDPPPSDNNRIYYQYDPGKQILIVQWYQTEGHTSGNWFDFEVLLHLGGQDRLVTEGSCGVVFSYHLIHFLYNTSSAGWGADNIHDPPAVGIEDEDGTHGIYYDGTLADGRVIRMGYKRVYDYDFAAFAILSPGRVVLRWTPMEPRVVCAVLGKNWVGRTAILDIYEGAGDSLGELVYHNIMGFYEPPYNVIDTAIGPCWEPGENGQIYTIRLIADMGELDECRHNDTLEQICYVHCDDTVGYDWNVADWFGAYTVQDERLGTFYPIEGGALVTGVRMYSPFPPADSGLSMPRIELWEADAGCGPVGLGDNEITYGDAYEYEDGWYNYHLGYGGWIASDSPGGIWAAATSPGGSSAGLITTTAQNYWAGAHPCYLGPGPGRGGTWQGSPSSGFSWGSPSGDFYTVPIEIITHLAFGQYPLSAPPTPPCYYGDYNWHDVTCFDMASPPSVMYVEDGVPITPELWIANNGRQTEPESGVFPAKFFAVDMATSDTVFSDTALIDHVGWLGDDADSPDTIYVGMGPWAPEGNCDESHPFADYECIGLVRLGEVGPDSSDHCPYNDTCREELVCLWSHDVGVTDLTWPEEGNPCEPGFTMTPSCTVENFGFNPEQDFEVWCIVNDVDSGNVELWHAVQNVTFLDWRGNIPGNPYTIQVDFPTYHVLTDHHQTITCYTMLEGDQCPDDDDEVRHICGGIEEELNRPRTFALDVVGPNVTDEVTVKFAVPGETWVKVDIFDVNGRWVSSLENDICLPGHYSKVWNGFDNSGRKAAAGIYLVRMNAEEFSSVRKIVLLK